MLCCRRGTLLATIVGRFKVQLDAQMGGWAGVQARKTVLGIAGGGWVHFVL